MNLENKLMKIQSTKTVLKIILQFEDPALTTPSMFNKRHQNEVNNVILVSLLLTWNIFGSLFWCLHCWLWTSKYWTGPSRKFSKTRIPEKSATVTCLTFKKAFKSTQVFQRRPLECTRIKQKIIKRFIFLTTDITLRYTLKTSFENLHK